MSGAWLRAGLGWRWFIALAVLALFLQVLVPPGYMVSADQGQPSLVICTGHGPLAVSKQDHPGKPAKPTPDAPCAFAAHGSASAPPPIAPAVPVAFDQPVPSIVVRFDLSPGRGLAAPPPPSHGPPA